MMTEAEAISRIEAECHSGDIEVDHDRSDAAVYDFLCVLGFEKLAAAWEAIEKRCAT